MRARRLAVIFCIGLGALTLAASATARPLLGSTQSIINSNFCKKYLCKPLNPNQSRGFYLYLPGDESLSELRRSGLLEGDSDITGLNENRTFVDFRFDSKKQFLYASFRLRDASYKSRGPYIKESAVIYEFYKLAIGTTLPEGLSKTQFGYGNDDIYKCIEQAKMSSSKRIIYKKIKMYLNVDKVYDDVTLECDVSVTSPSKGYYNPVVAIGFRGRSNDFINNNTYY